MPDAFEVLMTGLGPALTALDNSARMKVAEAQDAREQIREKARIEDERRNRRQELEDQRRYSETREQRMRSERKQDAEEDRLRALRVQVAALGGKPEGKPEEQLSKDIADLSLQKKIDDMSKMKDVEIREAARIAGIPDYDKKPVSQLRTETAEQLMVQEVLNQNRKLDLQVEEAKKSPYWEPMRNQFARANMAKNALMVQATAPTPEFNPDMTDQDRVRIGKALASDPTTAAAIKELPNGDQILNNLRVGIPGGVETVYRSLQGRGNLSVKLANSIYTSISSIEEKLKAGKEAQFSATMADWLAKVRAMPQLLQVADRDIEQMKRDPQFGLALQREDAMGLAEGAAEVFKSTMPGAAKPGAGLPTLPGGATSLTPNATPTPVGEDWTGGAGNFGVPTGPAPAGAGAAAPTVANPLIGPPPLMNSLMDRASQLRAQGHSRFAAEPVMMPLYEGVANELGVQPQPIGSSPFFRTPRAVVAENPDNFDAAFSALPPEKKNAILLNAIQKSYQDPTFRQPYFDWMRP